MWLLPLGPVLAKMCQCCLSAPAKADFSMGMVGISHYCSNTKDTFSDSSTIHIPKQAECSRLLQFSYIITHISATCSHTHNFIALLLYFYIFLRFLPKHLFTYISSFLFLNSISYRGQYFILETEEESSFNSLSCH